MSSRLPCPCGSQLNYEECCKPLHDGKAAPSPEALMRSRFTAFAMHKVGYLLKTWHPTTRPSDLDLQGSPNWTTLQVLDATETGDKGTVHFRAVFLEKGQWGFLEENSDFFREEGRWYYVTGRPRHGTLKPGRNDRCPCGSGRKYKVCCTNREE